MRMADVTLTVDEFLEHLQAKRIDDEFVETRFDELNAQWFHNSLPRPTFAACTHEGRYALFVPAPLRIITSTRAFSSRIRGGSAIRCCTRWCISSSTRKTVTPISSTGGGL